MGYLHKGHLSLMKKARKETDIVIISIFVNPTQFGPHEDYTQYPRDLEKDTQLAKAVGVDVVFVPTVAAMYPQGFSTFVNVEEITDCLCGQSRPGHFRGVTTVVMKLFNLVKPDIAYFGQKDAQQAIVIKRMVKDLDMDIKIKVLPIVRESDGLAMSSRNTYLNLQERKDATVLFHALQRARTMVASGVREPRKIISNMKRIIRQKQSAKIDYVAVVDTENLKTLKRISGEVLIALAVWIGKTRLIDNIIIRVKS
jgi:pantoate--beta-alanine ligase